MRRQRSWWFMVAAVLGVPLLSSVTHATSFTDRAAFTSAVAAAGLTAAGDDFDAYALGNIANGAARGSFIYTYPATTQAGIASDGAGGKALGDTALGTDPLAGVGVFVGGEAVTLTLTAPGGLLAFGADVFYAPTFDNPPAAVYRLSILDGAAAGTTVGNPAGLDAGGGSFFLGFLGSPGSAFSSVSLLSTVPLDANGDPAFLVGAYQIDNLLFAGPSAVAPEPTSLALLSAGLTVVLVVFTPLSGRRLRR